MLLNYFMDSVLKKYCGDLVQQFDLIPSERKDILHRIAGYISKKKETGKDVNLVYICTHNSRRSHFGQVWSYVAAKYFGVGNVHTFSGGTEVTAFNINAVNALIRAGFNMQVKKKGTNPLYLLYFDQAENPIECFSKIYDDKSIPEKGFAAIMTCGNAEQNCPFIPGAEIRISTTYEDPKAFDNTPLQDQKYDERSRQIARECLYVFSLI